MTKKIIGYGTAALIVFLVVMAALNPACTNRAYSTLVFGNTVELRGVERELPPNWWVKEADPELTLLANGYLSSSDDFSVITIQPVASTVVDMPACATAEGNKQLLVVRKACVASQRISRNGRLGLVVAVLQEGIEFKIFPIEEERVQKFLEDAVELVSPGRDSPDE